jgi:hypothetical protein
MIIIININSIEFIERRNFISILFVAGDRIGNIKEKLTESGFQNIEHKKRLKIILYI